MSVKPMMLRLKATETAAPPGRRPAHRYAGRGDAASSADLKKFAAEYKNALPKALKEADKQGIPTAWATTYFNDWFDELKDGLEVGDIDIREAVSELKSGMFGPGILNDYNGEIQRESITQVKQAGEKMFKNPSNKVKLLNKLGLTGAEFHAFCLMIKEQIK